MFPKSLHTSYSVIPTSPGLKVTQASISRKMGKETVVSVHWDAGWTDPQLVAFSLYAILENASKRGLAESSLEIRDQEEQKGGT